MCHAEAGGLCDITAFCLLNAQVNPVSVSEGGMRLEAPGLGRGGPSQRKDGCPALPCSFGTSPGAECDGATHVLSPSGPFPRSPGSCPLQAVAVPKCQCPVLLRPPSPGLPAGLSLKS